MRMNVKKINNWRLSEGFKVGQKSVSGHHWLSNSPFEREHVLKYFLSVFLLYSSESKPKQIRDQNVKTQNCNSQFDILHYDTILNFRTLNNSI